MAVLAKNHSRFTPEKDDSSESFLTSGDAEEYMELLFNAVFKDKKFDGVKVAAPLKADEFITDSFVEKLTNIALTDIGTHCFKIPNANVKNRMMFSEKMNGCDFALTSGSMDFEKEITAVGNSADAAYFRMLVNYCKVDGKWTCIATDIINRGIFYDLLVRHLANKKFDSKLPLDADPFDLDQMDVALSVFSAVDIVEALINNLIASPSVEVDPLTKQLFWPAGDDYHLLSPIQPMARLATTHLKINAIRDTQFTPDQDSEFIDILYTVAGGTNPSNAGGQILSEIQGLMPHFMCFPPTIKEVDIKQLLSRLSSDGHCFSFSNGKSISLLIESLKSTKVTKKQTKCIRNVVSRVIKHIDTVSDYFMSEQDSTLADYDKVSTAFKSCLDPKRYNKMNADKYSQIARDIIDISVLPSLSRADFIIDDKLHSRFMKIIIKELQA